jgi:peptidoglycan/xylan/chitin deacetylase (PgdA/CDA1 family)
MPTFATSTTSWDDGHPLDLRIADLLAKYDLTGTFYVPFEHSRQVMTPGQIRQLCGTFELGAHTVHHMVLTKTTKEVAGAEIRDSKRRMEDLTGTCCDAFCFPQGRFGRGHLDMVRQAGYRCARTVELLSTRLPAWRAGIHLIPTTVQASPHSSADYVKNCIKRLAPRNLMHFALYARARDWTATARSLLELVARQGGVFHLWGHSWEIEERQQWPQLESVLREMHQLRSALLCVTNSRLTKLDAVEATHTAPVRIDT